LKGELFMKKLAFAKDGISVSGHFGHCEGFELITIQNQVVSDREVIRNPGHQPGFLPVFLSDHGVNTIIAGGMGGRAQQLFKEAGIEVIVGVRGTIDAALEALLSDELKSTESVCSEHTHADSCGGH